MSGDSGRRARPRAVLSWAVPGAECLMVAGGSFGPVCRQSRVARVSSSNVFTSCGVSFKRSTGLESGRLRKGWRLLEPTSPEAVASMAEYRLRSAASREAAGLARLSQTLVQLATGARLPRSADDGTAIIEALAALGDAVAAASVATVLLSSFRSS